MTAASDHVTHRTPRTVRFVGAGELVLTADEWNGDAVSSSDHSTVLMLHGGGQTRHSWKKTGQILADNGFHVLTLDTRGHGDSEWSASSQYSLDDLGADVVAISSSVRRPLVLVGASVGGLAAITATGVMGPDVVRGLILVDIVPRFQGAGSDRVVDFMMGNLDGFESLEAAADAVAAYLPHRTRPATADGLRRNLRERDGRWFWHWDPTFIPAAAHGDDVAEKMERTVVELPVPVLLIRGKMSDVVTKDSSDAFLAKVPRARFVELNRAGHTAAADDNDAFSDAVVDFVRTTGLSN